MMIVYWVVGYLGVGVLVTIACDNLYGLKGISSYIRVTAFWPIVLLSLILVKVFGNKLRKKNENSFDKSADIK